MGRMPRSGEVIDDRFTIEHLAGAGGMGQVYRARDRRTGGLVALKVMHGADTLEIERFAREAQVLATLSHPGIVRYIDSGTTVEGEPYLVMEWLAGETLSARLQRSQLRFVESLALGRRVASALGAIHRRGVVHRDIKPSNVFLRNNAIDDVALIDFGMARRPVADPKLTVTGTMLGTPGYIAPEQVYSVSNIDGRADIFSLGCVLYRCISGQVPFRGHDALRILIDGGPNLVPRLRDLLPAIPAELDDLVARMLAKSPDDRPPNGDVVAAELAAIEENASNPLSVRGGVKTAPSEIMSTEKRLMCLVVARPPDRRIARPQPNSDRYARERALRAAVERHRGKLEILADGSLLVVLTNADAATDLAARAARCALAVRVLLGDGSVVVVSGQEVLGPGLPEGDLVDRAVDLLEATAKGTAIRIDKLTASLLKNRFDTGGTGRHLRGELPEADRMRLLFGGPVACVGREQELAQLETIFDRCAEERAATMAALTGPSGVGKSRLAHEFLHRLMARGKAAEIWLGEADPLNTGMPLGLVEQVLRRALGLLEDEGLEARREKLGAHLARLPDGGRLAPVLDKLVEGRLQPSELSDVFFDLLRAECAVRPVVLVLEDLHGGDPQTLKLVEVALGALADQPLMVLALARTKVTELVPQLGADRDVQEIRLRKLARRASEQMVKQVLGDVGEKTLRSLVERAEGHPAYLAELIRAAAEGKASTVPPTVLAMVQAQIEKLDPAARRVLRAASIFGETFWRGGVEALLGGGDAAAWLAELVEQDVIAVKDERRFPAEAELRFRHPLVREAVYGMLTEGDRVAGHWRAAQWLEQAGETDVTILAEHFALCGYRGGLAPHL